MPPYEVAKGVKLLPRVFSERLRLSGKCDIVEQHRDGSLCPVEHKKGKRRRFENDDDHRLGLLVNFNSVLIEDGIQRIAL